MLLMVDLDIQDESKSKENLFDAHLVLGFCRADWILLELG